MKRETKNTAVQPKTYQVYQDKYTTGYHIYDPSDENSIRPNKEDIIEQFEAEEGAEWYAYNTLTISIDEEDIEDSDYTTEDLDSIYGEELYNAVYEVVTDIEEQFDDLDENGGLFRECTEDYKVEAYDFNGETVTLEVKYKFQVVDGEVVYERVK